MDLQTSDRALCPARRSKVVLKAGISAFLHPSIQMHRSSDRRLQSWPVIPLLPRARTLHSTFRFCV